MKNWGMPAALAIVLVAVAFLMRGKSTQPTSPEDTVNALFNAAGRGDAEAYLRLLAEPLRTSIANTQSQLGPDKFAQSLRDSVTGVKGTAILNREPGTTPGTMILTVDLTFEKRSESQQFALAEQLGGWAIVSIGKAEISKPPIPYGTPVYDTGLDPAPLPAANNSASQRATP